MGRVVVERPAEPVVLPDATAPMREALSLEKCPACLGRAFWPAEMSTWRYRETIDGVRIFQLPDHPHLGMQMAGVLDCPCGNETLTVIGWGNGRSSLEQLARYLAPGHRLYGLTVSADVAQQLATRVARRTRETMEKHEAETTRRPREPLVGSIDEAEEIPAIVLPLRPEDLA